MVEACTCSVHSWWHLRQRYVPSLHISPNLFAHTNFRAKKAILGVSLAATLGLLTGSGSAGFLVGSCVGFVGASVAYHRLALAQAVVALRENPRLLQLHLAYNFPLAGFGGGAMTKAQLEAPYWRGSFHRQMLLIAAWQSASVQLDDVHEARTRAEVERIVRGEGRGLSLRRDDDHGVEHEDRIEMENRQDE